MGDYLIGLVGGGEEKKNADLEGCSFCLIHRITLNV